MNQLVQLTLRLHAKRVTSHIVVYILQPLLKVIARLFAFQADSGDHCLSTLDYFQNHLMNHVHFSLVSGSCLDALSHGEVIVDHAGVPLAVRLAAIVPP